MSSEAEVHRFKMNLGFFSSTEIEDYFQATLGEIERLENEIKFHRMILDLAFNEVRRRERESHGPK